MAVRVLTALFAALRGALCLHYAQELYGAERILFGLAFSDDSAIGVSGLLSILGIVLFVIAAVCLFLPPKRATLRKRAPSSIVFGICRLFVLYCLTAPHLCTFLTAQLSVDYPLAIVIAGYYETLNPFFTAFTFTGILFNALVLLFVKKDET